MAMSSIATVTGVARQTVDADQEKRKQATKTQPNLDEFDYRRVIIDESVEQDESDEMMDGDTHMLLTMTILWINHSHRSPSPRGDSLSHGNMVPPSNNSTFHSEHNLKESTTT